MRAIVATLLIILTPAAAAQTPAPPATGFPAPDFAGWHGDWTGTGTVLGRESTARARFAPALGGGALQFDYDLMMGGTPPQRFQGHGIYRVDAKGRITGQWSDTGGALHQLKGVWTPREWTVVWGSPLTEIGRSRYTLTDDGGLSVTDWTLQSDGNWRVFAEMRYRRVER
jgi:hypothetical protein